MSRLARFAGLITACVLALAVATQGSPPPDTPQRTSAQAAQTPLLDSGDTPPTPPPLTRLPPPKAPYTGELADPVLAKALDEATAKRSAAPATVRVEIIHPAGSDALAAALDAGATDIATGSDTLFAATMPAANVATLESSPEVTFVRAPVSLDGGPADAMSPQPALLGAAHSGSKGSDLTAKINVASWHKRGYKGKGVKIGVIDTFGDTALARAQAAGEVPRLAGGFCLRRSVACPNNILDDPFDPASHGVAVLEVIHDVAPSAQLYIASVYTVTDYYALIDYWAKQGVRIISRSLGTKYDGPGNGTGESAKLVNYAASKGIAWLNAAGNAGTQPWGDRLAGGYWRGTWQDTNGDGWGEFKDTRTGQLSSTIVGKCRGMLGLRWDDWGGNATDYDVYVYDTDWTLKTWSENSQVNGYWPLELNGPAHGCAAGQQYYYLAIYKRAEGNGSAGDVLELNENGLLFDSVTDYYAASGPFVDSKNPAFAAIGAIDPGAGKRIAVYSSWGPTNDGRLKPDFSAGSNFTNLTYGRFPGTSAATPAVAGAAAVVKSRYPKLTPAQLIRHMERYDIVDRGAKGPDYGFGRGELILDSVFTKAPVPKITGTVKRGKTVKAAVGTWAPRASKYKYQWYRGSTAIRGATSYKHKVTSNDVGKKLRVKVTASRTNFMTEVRYSKYTAKARK